MGKQGGQVVPQSGQRDHETEYPFRALTEDIPKEERGNNSAAVQDVILRHDAKVGDVYQQIRDSDEDQGSRTCAFDRTYGVADFGESIVRVTVT